MTARSRQSSNQRDRPDRTRACPHRPHPGPPRVQAVGREHGRRRGRCPSACSVSHAGRRSRGETASSFWPSGRTAGWVSVPWSICASWICCASICCASVSVWVLRQPWLRGEPEAGPPTARRARFQALQASPLESGLLPSWSVGVCCAVFGNLLRLFFILIFTPWDVVKPHRMILQEQGVPGLVGCHRRTSPQMTQGRRQTREEFGSIAGIHAPRGQGGKGKGLPLDEG